MIGLTVVAYFLKPADGLTDLNSLLKYSKERTVEDCTFGDQLEYEKESIDAATTYGEKKIIRFPEIDRKPTVLNENPSIQPLKIIN